MSSLDAIRNYVRINSDIGTAGQPGAEQDMPVFVHCIMNCRVSAFVFLYLTQVRGIAPEQARSPIFEGWQPDEKWQAIMQLDADDLLAVAR